MLRKLLKYELLSTGRIFLPLYLALLGVSVILKAFMLIEKSARIYIVPQVLLTVLYIILVIASFALVYIFSCMRFYKNMLGDEGYLMHTLPVKPYKHIFAKLFASILWLIASFIIAAASVIILAYQKGLFEYIFKMINNLMAAVGLSWSQPSVVWTTVAMVALSVASCINGFMMLYASMAVGQLLRGHRIIGSILAYFGFYTASQIISLVMLFVISRTGMWRTLEEGNLGIIGTGAWNPFSAFFTIVTVLYIVYLILYFIITNYMLSRKLSLE